MIKGLIERANHEYWPWWAIYLPVFPLYLWQAVRSRRAAFFTNVNPAIDMGGFFGERKSAIYPLLPDHSYPSTVRIIAGTDPTQALAQVQERGMTFPLIVKPDVGERGSGVWKVRDAEHFLDVLSEQHNDLLAQALAPGEMEYGLMFARDPLTGRTELLSITSKVFLTVTGDGVRSVDQLLSTTFRGDRQRKRLRELAGNTLATIPAAGEHVRVEPIGNHCRGTLFMNGAHLRTPQLELAVDQLIGATQGIHYGRLDVRSESDEALGLGRFTIVELNGVSSEPGHIYDPSWSIWRCWAELVRHVRHIGRISQRSLEQGVEPCSLNALLHRCELHFGWRLGVLRRVTAKFA